MSWRELTYAEYASYLNRIPDVVGAGRQEQDDGDKLEMSYYREKYDF